ncbi:Glutathione transferase GST 23 [Morella rubra]|uniref:glutathione transferase n=1 Tax=Morella rubra TaxID=262757 RepID=A0A6A1WH45_9ROSI|nr:Glutathione transferase GST 23 [Morella rubra]
MMAEEVKLFRSWSSPFPLRVVWALELKGIPYEVILEDLSNKSSLLLHYNPIHKKVPVLVHNGKSIAESLVILEYVEETWKQTPSLLPEDPYERAMERFWAKFGDDKHRRILIAISSNIIAGFAITMECLHQAREGPRRSYGSSPGELDIFRRLLRGKNFFSGERIGFLDLAFGWLANMVSVFEEVMGATVLDNQKLPSLSAWMKNFMDAPIIKESWPPRDKLITKHQALRQAHIEKEAPK